MTTATTSFTFSRSSWISDGFASAATTSAERRGAHERHRPARQRRDQDERRDGGGERPQGPGGEERGEAEGQQ